MSPSHSIKQKSKLNNSSLHFNWCSIPNTWLLLSESGMIVIETTRKTVYMIMQYYIAQCITVSTIFLLLILHKHQMMKLLNAEWQLLNFMASLLSLVIVNPHIYSSWTCLKRYLLFLGNHEHRLPLVSFLFCQYVSSAPINFLFLFFQHMAQSRSNWSDGGALSRKTLEWTPPLSAAHIVTQILATGVWLRRHDIVNRLHWFLPLTSQHWHESYTACALLARGSSRQWDNTIDTYSLNGNKGEEQQRLLISFRGVFFCLSKPKVLPFVLFWNVEINLFTHLKSLNPIIVTWWQ